MAVDIYIKRGEQTIDIFPLSNQPFIESYYIPTAEKMGLELVPLILRAAGLVVDAANKSQVIAELSIMDNRADEYVRARIVKYILSVNDEIRKAISGHMTDSDLSLYIG
jgi:hypothetical protein